MIQTGKQKSIKSNIRKYAGNSEANLHYFTFIGIHSQELSNTPAFIMQPELDPSAQ